MKHPYNHQLFAYWNERRGRRPAPERADIEPGAMRRILGDSFVLSLNAERGHPFRVAGTRICALFGRELRGEPFSALWDDESVPQIHDLVAIIAEDGVGVVAGARATTAEDLQCNLEMLLLPLMHRGQLGLRMLGVIAAMERPYWLGMWSARPLRLGVIQFVGPDAIAGGVNPAGAALPHTITRPSFTVIPGGRA